MRQRHHQEPDKLPAYRELRWDYRYTWIRDAAFIVYALMRIGFTEEAGCFMAGVEQRAHEPNCDGSLQITYSIDGRHELPEETLDHLEGYRGLRPVQVGNGAYNQLQLDIYGELFDLVYLGPYTVETGPCGEALGNFPQAFTHLALISAAFNLDRALGGR